MINHEERVLKNPMILPSFVLVGIIFCIAHQVDRQSCIFLLAGLVLMQVELAQPLLSLSFISYLLLQASLLFGFRMIEDLHA